MLLSESEIKEITGYYNPVSIVKYKGRLEDGFQSENFHIQSTQGDYVVRIIFDTEKKIELCMIVCDYLGRNGIKTPVSLCNKENSHVMAYKGQYIVIQTFIEGIFELETNKVNDLLEFYGRELGRVHKVSK